jgi:hypothetical protein
MTTDAEVLLDSSDVETSSRRQRLFMRYFTAVLVDLTVLNLFAEYWDRVLIDSFTISLFAAILLQVLLKLTVAIEHRAAAHFLSMPGAFAKFMRYASAWAILFSSKFVILGALQLAFGDGLHFVGKAHGIVPLLIVIVAMLVAEEAIVRLYRRLE